MARPTLEEEGSGMSIWVVQHFSVHETESLTTIDQSAHTPGCDEVWRPLLAMVLDGTHLRGVWTGADPSWSRGGA
jgi:hypothetical protein